MAEALRSHRDVKNESATADQVAGTRPLEPLLLRIPEAARILSIGRSTLYELIAAGEVDVVRVGRAARIPVAALHDFVSRRRGRSS